MHQTLEKAVQSNVQKKNEINPEMQNKLASIQSIPITTQYVTPQVVSTSMIFGKDWLNDDHIAINTKFQPTILRYYRNSWKN